MKAKFLPLLASLALAGCIPILPGPHGDYDIAFARSYFRSGASADPRTLTVPQLYAAHRYMESSTHPSRGLTGEFIRRGAETVPFLRSQLAQPQSLSQLSAVLDLFKAMQTAGAFDPRSDPALIALIQQAANSQYEAGSLLRDRADELETGTRYPNRWPPWGRRPFEGLGRDYDRDFAKGYCRKCDTRDWLAGLDALSIEQLYAVQRLGWEDFDFPRDIDSEVAKRGAAAVPLLKDRLANGGDSGFMVWNIMSVLQRMQVEGRYDVLGDAELMRLAEAAVGRVKGGWSGYVKQNLEDLRQRKLSVW